MLQKRVRKASLTEAAKPAGQKKRETPPAKALTAKALPANAPLTANVTPLPLKSVTPSAETKPETKPAETDIKDSGLSITEPSRSLLMQAVTNAESEPSTPDLPPVLGPLERLRFERSQKPEPPKPETTKAEPVVVPQAAPSAALTEKHKASTPQTEEKPEIVKPAVSMNQHVKPELFQSAPLRHKVTDEELEILNGAKTRIEWRLFWLSLGIMLGACLGAIPALLRFQSDKILTLEGFFQNVLFFAFGLLAVVLGMILLVKHSAMKRAYAEIKARS